MFTEVGYIIHGEVAIICKQINLARHFFLEEEELIQSTAGFMVLWVQSLAPNMMLIFSCLFNSYNGKRW